jgi:hypothetical protein
MHSLWCTINILWCYNKFDILLSEYPDKFETQDELELQSYLLDKSDLEKFPLNQISTIISYCKTCVNSTGNIRSFGEDLFICRTNCNKTSK